MLREFRARARRFDGLSICRRTGLLVGYEVKVSRHDAQMELKNPRKMADYAALCNELYLLTTPGLIEPTDLPRPYGLLEFDPASKALTKVRPAKRRPRAGLHGETLGLLAATVFRMGQADLSRKEELPGWDHVFLLIDQLSSSSSLQDEHVRLHLAECARQLWRAGRSREADQLRDLSRRFGPVSDD
jgi:hypothetical protein